jgi:uncharacterized membrane protein YoaK (UPF0700 family)
VTQRRDRRQEAMLLALAWTAGYLDAISFFGLGGVFTAIMTGNTVFLGAALSRGQVRSAASSGVALLGFALGVAAGALMTRRAPLRRGWSPAVTALVAVEAAALCALALGWPLLRAGAGSNAHPPILLAALAMGLQSAAVRRVGVPDVATTYVTGSLAGALERLIRGGAPGAEPAPAGLGWRLPAAVWALSGLGAMAGGAAVHRLGRGLIWPAAAVVAAVAIAGAADRRGEVAPTT